MDPRIKIRHLQSLIEIVRQGSLKRAAERLNLTQPAISRSLAELEDITGTRLLNRNRAGVSLTGPGEYLHSAALDCLSTLEQGLDRIAEAGRKTFATLTVGALPSVAARLLPEIVLELSVIAPDMRLTIADGSHEHLTRMLRAGDLDVVIGRLGSPDTMQGLSFTQLYLEEVAIITRPGHPMLAEPDLRRISSWPVIYPPPWAAIRPLIERYLIATGIAVPTWRIESVSGAFGRAYVQASDAVWFISAGVVSREIAAGRLARFEIATELTAGPVGIMIRANDRESPEMAQFRAAVDSAVAMQALPDPT